MSDFLLTIYYLGRPTFHGVFQTFHGALAFVNDDNRKIYFQISRMSDGEIIAESERMHFNER